MIKQLGFIVVVATFAASCKKSYTCECSSSRRGFVTLQFQQSYKEKSRHKALDKCESDYKNMPGYTDDDGSCELK